MSAEIYIVEINVEIHFRHVGAVLIYIHRSMLNSSFEVHFSKVQSRCVEYHSAERNRMHQVQCMDNADHESMPFRSVYHIIYT